MKEEDSFKFPHSTMSLPTPLLTPSQTNSGSNKSNEENTALVKTSDFENVNTQNEEMHTRSDTGPAQSFNDFVEEEVDNPLTNPLALPPTISTHQSSCT